MTSRKRTKGETETMGNLQKRSQAFESIIGEMRYQKDRSSEDEWDHKNVPSVEGEILMMQEYINKARTAYTVNPGNEQALHELRKVTAMGVRAMMNHGVFPREGYEK